MADEPRLVNNDGLTVTEQTDLTSLTDEEWRALGPKPFGFEWQLREIEQEWLPHEPPRRTLPDEHTHAWYAKRILRCIRHIRLVLGREQGQIEDVGHAALQVGRLHTDAFWRLNLGDQTRLGIKTRRNLRAAASKARTRDQQDVADSNARIDREARRIRQRHVHSREYSTRRLAREVAKVVVDCSVSTIRRRLKTLGIS